MSRAAMIAVTRRLGPMTAKQLAAELRVSDSTARATVRRARAHGTKFLRIAEWAGDVPKYGPGPGDDAEGGATGVLILARLRHDGPATISEIAVEIGVSSDAADAAARRLRQKRGKMHIVGWRLVRGRGGREAAIYAFGRGDDAPRPDFTNAQQEAERRYAEKRRIAHVLDGGGTRRPRRPSGSATSPFAGLGQRAGT